MSNREKPININIPTTTPQTTNNAPISIVAKNLNTPWSIAFLPNNDLLVTERDGKIKVIDATTGETKITHTINEVKQEGESGLHGIAIHPNFEMNKFIYVYYTYQADGNNTLNRVVRYTYDQSRFSEDKIIVDGIPGALFHDGGRVKFGPDNLLYITTGDAQEPSLSQSITSLAGKILRVTDDGSNPKDNPFDSPIYSLGHRNPQGITWDENERLFETEHGSSAYDELNLIEKGANYGWPTTRGDAKKEGILSPLLHSEEDTWAPGGIAYLDDYLYFTGLRGQALYRTDLNGQNLKEFFKKEYGRIRDVVVGPDNYLYLAISNRDGRGLPSSDDDKIIRVNPKEL